MSHDFAAPRAASLPPARALSPSPAYWGAMLAASALGTNLGDFGADLGSLGLIGSAGWAALAALAIIVADRLWPREALFWLAIVLLRALATNIGDGLTYDLALSRPAASLIFGGATLAAGYLTVRGRSPLIDARYWLAMGLGGVFGTVCGDMVSHAVGLPLATAGLGALVVVAILAREAAAPLAALGYWVIVLAERAAGTAAGDLIAEHRGLGFGLPASMAATGALLALALWLRRRA